MDALKTKCCIVGGGPAGVMAGYLLARAGVPVIVLEKHRDFFRDFRGDTVHPSTLELFHELGLLDEFLKVPHQKLTSVGLTVGGEEFEVASFRHVPGHSKFVALMPQWDFLNFLAGEARKFPEFDLRMEHEAVGLLRDGERVTGVRVKTPAGENNIEAQLVLGCDGRHSITRTAAELEVVEEGVPIDVLWFRLSRMPGDPEQVLGNINYGRALILINRGHYFQAGMIVPKGSFDEIQRAGLLAFQESIVHIAPFLGKRAEEIYGWDQVKLLTVQINRLVQWFRTGLLCIGDAAHAMSPAGGVGINLAIQDAVAAARILADPLLNGPVSDETLSAVQSRREFPTRATQFIQVNAHKAIERVFHQRGAIDAPWQLRVISQIPGVQRLAGRAVGTGFRPEHAEQTDPLRELAISLGKAAGKTAAALTLWLRRYNFAGRA